MIKNIALIFFIYFPETIYEIINYIPQIKPILDIFIP